MNIFGWRVKKHDFVAVSVIAIVGFLSWWVNKQRVIFGYFTDHQWIFLDGLMYTLLSALVIGYVVSEVILKH